MRKILVIASLSALVPRAHAASLVISTASGTAGADTYIRNDGGAGPNNNFGAATQMIVGSNSGPLNGLLRFDLAALQSATGGQAIVVDSVTLTLHTTNNGGGGGFTMGLNDYGSAFVEGTGNGAVVAGASSWNNPAGNGADATAGGTAGTQYQTLAVASTSGGQTLSFASSAGLVADIQSAYNTGTNASYLLKENGSTIDQTFLRFDTKDTVGGTVPFLTINYTVVPEPSAGVLGGLGLLGVWRRRR